ncbi:MAG: proline racemase family protein, partial [Candidatus Bipolaricaulota bacterium]
ATVAVEGSVAKNVTFKNVPSFVYKTDVKVDVPGYGRIILDIAYGGNFYALVEASKLGLDIVPERAGDLVRAGIAIREAVNAQIRVQHPEKPFIEGLTHVEFYGPPTHRDAHAKNAVVIPPGSIDRSPCGTGTSAKLATLYAKKEWKLGQQFIHESIIGTVFQARIVKETKVGDIPAVVPEITGSAYITGIHQFVVDPDDPLKEGFLLGMG